MLLMNNFLSLFISAFFLLGISIVYADVTCEERRSKINAVEASAGTWGNFRNNKGSLRYETTRLIEQGFEKLSKDTKLEFESIPQKFKDDYSNKSYCESKLEETSDSPITFTTKQFKSIDDMQDWIADFSKGDGEEGEELYSICDRDCSPQYKYFIYKDKNEKIKLDPSVVCGHARDKSNNMYELSMYCSPIEN